MEKVFVFLADGFEEIEAISIIDVLRRANIETITVSISKDKVVTGAHAIPVTADVLFDDCSFDDGKMLVLPGGMPGTTNLKNHKKLGELITQYQHDHKLLGAICAAPSVLGHLGVLQNKKAVCFPGFEDELTGAKVIYEPTMMDGDVITGRGAGVAIHFALVIVEKIKGTDTALNLAKKMLVPAFS